MDQIAADSRTFSEILTRLSPRPIVTHRDSPSDQQAGPGGNLIATSTSASAQTNPSIPGQAHTNSAADENCDRLVLLIMTVILPVVFVLF